MNKNNPTISIVTACFNAEKSIKNCLLSIQSQSFDDYEHIVIDGNSTDSTLKVIEEHAGSNCRVISEKDDGIADAMNKGIKAARGDFIIFIHADDLLLNSNSLQIVAQALDNQTDIACFDVIFGKAHRLLKANNLKFYWNFKIPGCHQGMLFRRSLFDSVGLFKCEFKLAMDYELILRAIRAGYSIRVVNTPIAYMGDEGISSRVDWSSLRKRFAEERKIHKIYASSKKLRLLYTIYWPLYLGYRKVVYWLKSI
ncbi:glycosyltransferase family 2 protein [Aliikangiella sp. IMCC44653]